MKFTWNRIVQALRGRSAATPSAAEAAMDAQYDNAVGTAAANPWAAEDSRPLRGAYLLPTARTVRWLALGTVVVAAGVAVVRNPPVRHLDQGELGQRVNQFTGSVTQWRDGGVWVLPGVHNVRVFLCVTKATGLRRCARPLATHRCNLWKACRSAWT